MKSPAFGEVAKDYATRIARLHPFAMEEIPEKSYRARRDRERQKEAEAQLIRKRLRPGSFLIVLEEKGKEFNSVDLAWKLKALLESAAQEVVFVVGGAYGFPESIKQEAKLLWSLSKLTLPHQLARVLTLEQIYRALTLLKNVPYHHD